MPFTKEQVQEIGNAIRKAVKETGEKYGVRADLGNITYSAQEFGGKVTVKTAEPLDLSKTHSYLNLLPLGTKFTGNGENWVILEHQNKPKFNLKCQNSKGEIRLFNSDQLRRTLEARGLIKPEGVMEANLKDNK